MRRSMVVPFLPQNVWLSSGLCPSAPASGDVARSLPFDTDVQLALLVGFIAMFVGRSCTHRRRTLRERVTAVEWSSFLSVQEDLIMAPHLLFYQLLLVTRI